MVVLALAAPFALGWLAAAALLRGDTEAGLLERLSCAFPLGAAVLAMELFLLGLARVPLAPWPVLAIVFGEVVVAALVLRGLGIELLPARRSQGAGQTARGPAGVERLAAVLLGLWICAKLGSVLFEAGLRPIWAWDSWSNWSASAKLFYHSQGLLLDEPAEYFFGRGVASRIPGYPPLNPMLQAWMCLCLGSFDEVLAKLWTPLYLVSGALYLYAASRRVVGLLLSLTLVVALLSSPLLSYHAVEAYSDLPLSIYLLLSLGCFIQAVQGRWSAWLLSGVFCGCALFVKDEGVLFAPLLLAAAAVWLARERSLDRGRRAAALARLALPLLLMAPWYLFKLRCAPTMGTVSDFTALIFRPGNLVKASALLFNVGNFSVVFLFLPVLGLLHGRRDRAAPYAGLVLAGYIAAFFALYVFVPDYDTHFNLGTVFFRNLLTAYPSACLLAAVLLGEGRGRAMISA